MGYNERADTGLLGELYPTTIVSSSYRARQAEWYEQSSLW